MFSTLNNNLAQKAFSATVQVDNSTNYDNITTAGVYFYNSWAGDPLIGNNQPETAGNIGSMIVIAHGPNRDQFILSHLGIYFRRYNGATWSAWKSLLFA